MQYQKIGPYILLQRIASGGMANIFLAKKTGPNNLNSFYAVKKILTKYAKMPEFHKMFHEEAKITNAIGLDIHKNVMTSATYEKVGNHYIFVMEYIKGLNLKYFLKLAEKKEILLSTESILYIIAEIASGLNHLHSVVNLKTGQPLNLVHRDISPQNVMISHNGQIKIIDFGIAKASILEETQLDAGIKGKMAYMSPEQSTGGSLDAKSDIFSLGVVLWELLSKRRLFLADSSIKTLRNVRDCQVPDVRTFNSDVSDELARIVKKSLEKNKEARYKHATDLAQDLYAAIQAQKNFSSYNFEKLSRQIYADDIIENRRLLAKYINISDDKTTSVKDITNAGMDTNKIDQEKTQDLSLRQENSRFKNSLNKSASSTNIDLDLDLDNVLTYKIKSDQKNLATPVLSKTSAYGQKRNSASKTKASMLSKNYKNNRLFSGSNYTRTIKPEKNSSPVFVISLSLFLAIAGFFFLSSKQQQNIVFKKTLVAASYVKSMVFTSSDDNKKTKLNVVSPVLKAPENFANKGVVNNTFLTYFNTSPSGVEIFIDDMPVGISPNNVLLKKNSLVKITLKKQSYKTEEFKLNTNRLLKKYRQPASVSYRVQIRRKIITINLKKLKTKNNLIR